MTSAPLLSEVSPRRPTRGGGREVIIKTTPGNIKTIAVVPAGFRSRLKLMSLVSGLPGTRGDPSPVEGPDPFQKFRGLCAPLFGQRAGQHRDTDFSSQCPASAGVLGADYQVPGSGDGCLVGQRCSALCRVAAVGPSASVRVFFRFITSVSRDACRRLARNTAAAHIKGFLFLGKGPSGS